MQLGDAINKLVKDNKKSHASLSQLIGRKNPTYISNICIRSNTNVNTLLEITDALDYEVVIRPRNQENSEGRSIILEKTEK